jgi:hypothetical protein
MFDVVQSALTIVQFGLKLFDRHFRIDVVGNYETCTKNDSSADGGRQQSSADENNESLQVKFKEVDHKLLRLLASRGGPLSSVFIRQVHPPCSCSVKEAADHFNGRVVVVVVANAVNGRWCFFRSPFE